MLIMSKCLSILVAARLLNGLLQSEFAELLEVFRAQHLEKKQASTQDAGTGHQQKGNKVRSGNQLEIHEEVRVVQNAKQHETYIYI